MIIFIVLLVVSAIAGYLLGSINSAIIVGRFYGVEIRSKGSGNAGMTNTMRNLGAKAGILVIIVDIAKGVIACLIGLGIMQLGATFIPDVIKYVADSSANYMLYGKLFGGLFAIVGHNWPLYFGFKGGKGVLTSLAVLSMLNWPVALLSLMFFAIIFLVFGYVSLGSIVAALAYLVMTYTQGFSDVLQIVVVTLICLLIVFTHRANIKRLISGNENKTNIFKKNKKAKDDINEEK
jgi:glycerol-3-phosphate acyltransferase PlsY